MPSELQRRRSARERGNARARAAAFTLIEVLAALIIVSLGMLGVIQAVGQTASNSIYLRDKTLAHWIAMNRLTEARLQRSAPKIDKTSDEVEMAGRRWRWTMNVTQTPVETIRRIDVSVRYSEAKEGSSLASISGFYGAAVAPPGAAQVRWEGDLGTGGPQGPGQGGQEGQPENNPPQNNPPENNPPENNPPENEQPVDPGEPETGGGD